MIINLVGPPCASKSTFASRFILEHPQFRYCSIDEYRIEYKKEVTAWLEMANDILEKEECIIESCGMSWRLKELLNLPVIKERPILTIEFTANRETLFKRLKERQKRFVPCIEPQDEFKSIDYALEHLYKECVSPVDYTIDTTNKSEIEVYQEINGLILLNPFEKETKEKNVY